MLILASTADLVRVVTGQAADIESHVSWMDFLSGAITVGRTNTASITTATTTTVVPSPAASTQRNVKLLSLRNNHATQECDVTVEHTDGTNVETLIKVTLLVGEALVLPSTGEWYRTFEPAGIAEMEVGTALSSVVVPGRQHSHPGHPKVWCKCGSAGNILVSYNITSVTDTAAGRATFNIATVFSSTNYVWIATVERTSTGLGVSALKHDNIRNATPAAGSIEVEVYDGTVVTAVQEDPTAYYVAGYGDQ